MSPAGKPHAWKAALTLAHTARLSVLLHRLWSTTNELSTTVRAVAEECTPSAAGAHLRASAQRRQLLGLSGSPYRAGGALQSASHLLNPVTAARSPPQCAPPVGAAERSCRLSWSVPARGPSQGRQLTSRPAAVQAAGSGGAVCEQQGAGPWRGAPAGGAVAHGGPARAAGG